MAIRKWQGLTPVALLLPILLLGGCRGEPAAPAEPGKVLLIGLDGAEWDLIRPMAAAGELPNLARLMKTGASGNLRSLEPAAVSPAIWTTIATGKSPEAHRIESFTASKRNQATTGRTRAVRTVWDIASEAGRTVGVVGWLVSWPAEKVNGFMVTDYIQYVGDTKDWMQGRPDRTYPPALADEIAPLVVRSDAMPWSAVQRFLDLPLDVAALDKDVEGLLMPIKGISAADLSYTQIAAKLYRGRSPDLFAVYLRGMDGMGHLFWNYMQPEAPGGDQLNAKGMAYLKGTMRAYYRYTDEQVGRIVALADDRTTIIVVSDHGFKGGPGRGVQLHDLDGVLVMAGHNVKRGEVTGASVYDLTPTLLVLLGIAPAKDMRGKVLWSALDPAIPRERYTPVVATYETGKRPVPGPPPNVPPNDGTMEQLKALGYVE